MNSLVSKKLWGQDFFYGTSSFISKKKKVSFFNSCVGGFAVFAWRNVAARIRASMVAQMVKKIGPQCGGPRFALWVRRAPGEGHGCGLLPGESQGQRSLVGFRDAGADALSSKVCHTRVLRRQLNVYGPPDPSSH